MGVNLYMEDERGTRLHEVLDPQGFVGCIVSLGGHQKTACLRFIDPYGDTVFNQLQIPVLIRELEVARDSVTDERLANFEQKTLERARKANAGPTVIQGVEPSNRRFSASDVRSHIERVLDLARRAQTRVHAYLKFYGD